ncbi:hypothetical protein HDU78_002206 [Chytriomyces hyalinus]|nr:hypothetical protein HDU78_002206 [Chytriomyces hyalinus]
MASLAAHSLDSSSRNLDSMRSPTLFRTPNLVELNLSCNNIREIEGLESLVNLHRLILSFNKITSLQGIADAASSKLYSIDLKGNLINDFAQLEYLAGVPHSPQHFKSTEPANTTNAQMIQFFQAVLDKLDQTRNEVQRRDHLTSIESESDVTAAAWERILSLEAKVASLRKSLNERVHADALRTEALGMMVQVAPSDDESTDGGATTGATFLAMPVLVNLTTLKINFKAKYTELYKAFQEIAEESNQMSKERIYFKYIAD